MPGMEMLGPTTKPPRRFRIFHRTRCREENEGGGLGRDTIFAGQPRPDVVMRVGTAAFLNKEKAASVRHPLIRKHQKHPSDTVVPYRPLLHYPYLYPR